MPRRAYNLANVSLGLLLLLLAVALLLTGPRFGSDLQLQPRRHDLHWDALLRNATARRLAEWERLHRPPPPPYVPPLPLPAQSSAYLLARQYNCSKPPPMDPQRLLDQLEVLQRLQAKGAQLSPYTHGRVVTEGPPMEPPPRPMPEAKVPPSIPPSDQNRCIERGVEVLGLYTRPGFEDASKGRDPSLPRVLGLALAANTNPDSNDMKYLRRMLTSADKYYTGPSRIPVAIFHEGYQRAFMDEIQAIAPNTTLVWVEIRFKIPDHLAPYDGLIWNVTHIDHGRINAHEHGLCMSWRTRQRCGYQHMCRFMSGAAYQLPIFDDYEYVVRMDSDIEFFGLVPDQTADMKRQGLVYFCAGFAGEDSGVVVEDLWNTALRFLSSYKLSAVGPIGAPGLQGVNGEMTGVPILKNWFEISELAMLRDPERYYLWFRFADDFGGFHFHRWGDHAFRMLGLNMFYSREKIRIDPNVNVVHEKFKP
eukprot:gnl/Hemi2/24756_TR8329_c0_g1_i1.p1 gnl/Hemi2/24756_TR8329_c0_g1~~gnl/Hemi2/24756_TR8329_c0_g1_i1.p1  ORF type:complete len:477 (+),score=163.61 gnl/Hemi2/24756_TR8329_c0_g1_i1:146-1576(+)